jgi:hypothetical protein
MLAQHGNGSRHEVGDSQVEEISRVAQGKPG